MDAPWCKFFSSRQPLGETLENYTCPKGYVRDYSSTPNSTICIDGLWFLNEAVVRSELNLSDVCAKEGTCLVFLLVKLTSNFRFIRFRKYVFLLVIFTAVYGRF